jgi:branched-chain amino acid transport system substrate-binding protein
MNPSDFPKELNMTSKPLTRRQAIQTSVAAASAMSLMPSWAQDAKQKEVVIGQSCHLTGPLAPSLIPLLKGQDLAIEEINRKGGIGGKPLRLIKRDDAFDPKKAIENTHKFIDEDKVVALTGYASTANVGAVLPILLEKKMPLVGAYGGSPSLRVKQHPYFFTTTASYRDEVVQMIRNLVTTQKSQIGVVYQNHAFGQLMLPVVESVAKELGATIVGKQSLEMNGSDAVAAAQALSASKPNAVLLMAFGPSTVPMIKAVRAYIGAPVYALSIANAKQLVEALGDDGRGMAYTQTMPYPWRQTTPLTRDFGAVMSKAGLGIDYDHFLGYVNMRVVIEGLKRAGGAGKVVTPASVVTAMESMSKVDLGGYALNFGPQKHHGSSFVEITIVGPGGRYMR